MTASPPRHYIFLPTTGLLVIGLIAGAVALNIVIDVVFMAVTAVAESFVGTEVLRILLRV